MSNAKSLTIKSFSKISAGLLVLGAIGLASQAHAQTVDMPFDGNIPGSCTFGTITPGVLARLIGPGPNYAVMATAPGVTPGGGPPVGTASSVTVTCTTPSVLTIAAPTGSGPVGFTPAVRQALVQSANGGPLASANVGGTFEPGGPWNTTNPTMPLLPGAPQLLNVSMVAGNGPLAPPVPGPLPTGNYSYTVNLSITGN
jgi:hypothetical protein